MNELTEIKGIGPSTASKLAVLGIRTACDLIRTFPVRYERHVLTPAKAAPIGTAVAIQGVVVQSASVAYIRKRLTKLTLDVLSDGIVFRITAFNREFLRPALAKGAELVATGRFETGRKQFLANDIVLSKNYREGIVPVYGLEGLSDRLFAKFVAAAIPLSPEAAKETLPARILQSRRLAPMQEVLAYVHQPRDEAEISAASRRVKYEELLRFGLAVKTQKRKNDAVVTIPKKYDIERVRAFITALPFELTDDQKQATNEIFLDLKKPRRMLRMLQGDVGSGKTVVAAIAVYAVHTVGEQTAFMAPTEILARQHAQNLTRLFAPFGVTVAYLSGAVKGAERKRVIDGLASGTLHVVCGTHALIQEPVVFKRLGFAVIDEQHRFGVAQRKILREKGYDPDVLVMSATPIPRTLAIALFGDMDVSTIRALPSGRKPIKTDVTDFTDFQRLADAIAHEIAAGRQAYVIAPLVGSDAESDAYSVPEAVELLRGHMPSGINIASLHGQMKSADKDAIIDAFRTGETDILVATTVVEVGVDVPNATVMIILNADRFGLSQLHQLRGRVGRGGLQSFCHLVTDVARLEEGRLAILAETNDGFLISEEDLRRRGPGDVFGEAQTGMPAFKAANVIDDRDLLEAAFTDASTLFDDPDHLARILVGEAASAIDAYHLD
ncbi:MAG: ATP-dependent DNA helicase RecG [Tenericutes bacterium GWF2_57_13]|nr:MAG: ATP-dependent DNA helicase RecG [Tenericutes bacterium GWF2_57_13]